jgi:hypothetical protein
VHRVTRCTASGTHVKLSEKSERISGAPPTPSAPAGACGRKASLSPSPPIAASAAPNCGARSRAPANLPISPAAHTRRPGPGNTSHRTTSHTLSHTHTASGAAASPPSRTGAAPVVLRQVFLPGHAQTRGQPAPMPIRWRTVALQPHICGRVTSDLAPIYVILTFPTLICHARPCAGHPRLVFLMR